MVRERETTFSAPNLTILNFVLPAGEASPQPPLSALLGQVQINASEFCKTFNSLSLNDFYPGTLVNVQVKKFSDNRINIFVKGVFIPFLFFQASTFKRRRRIYVETLFDVFRICQNSYPNMNPRQFFGTLRTSKFKPKLLKDDLLHFCSTF